jgi:hypothetical protein
MFPPLNHLNRLKTENVDSQEILIIRMKEIPSFLDKTLKKSLSFQKLRQEFAEIDICPLNPDVFHKYGFISV